MKKWLLCILGLWVVFSAFSQGNLMQADELVNLLNRMSITNADKWQKILSKQ